MPISAPISSLRESANRPEPGAVAAWLTGRASTRCAPRRLLAARGDEEEPDREHEEGRERPHAFATSAAEAAGPSHRSDGAEPEVTQQHQRGTPSGPGLDASRPASTA